jgi:hypothetical protein
MNAAKLTANASALKQSTQREDNMQYIRGVGSHNPGDCAIQALTNCFQTPYVDNLEFARRRFGYPLNSGGGVDFESYNAWLIRNALMVCTFHGVRGCLWVSSRIDDSKAKRYNRRMTLAAWLKQSEAQSGHWIVSIRGHVFAVVNGVVCDNYAPSNRCVMIAAYKMKD